MTNKCCIVGDLHFGMHENDSNFIEYQFRTLKWVYDECRKRNVNKIIFLGDVFDKRRTVNLKILDKIYKEFGPKDIEHYFLLGNHDSYYKNNNDVNSLDCLMGEHKIVSQYPEHVKVGDHEILLTPWINKENYDESIKRIKSSKSKIMLGHLELSGFELIRGFISEHSSLPISELDKFDHVISGHYHCHSQKGNITYLGSMCQLTWSDLNEKKYIGFLDLDKSDFELVNTPEDYYTILRIKSLQLNNIDIEYYRNKKVKIYLYVDRKIKVEKLINSIVEIASSVNVIDEQVLVNTQNVDIDASSLSIQELWNSYINELEITQRDKKIINNIFNSTYNQVQTGNIDDFE